MKKTIWEDNIKMPDFSENSIKKSTDVLIIGGGILGILCAYFLKERGVDYQLLEKESIASGTTKGTTGKITCQHGVIYSEILEKYGLEYAKDYYKINSLALKKYEELSKKYSCDFENKRAYTYSLTDYNKMEKELKAYDKLGIKAEFTKETELPFKTAVAISMENQGQFHPLKFISKLSKGLNIVENTFVKRIEKGYVEASNGEIIRAKKIIVATHFPIINTRGFYFLKLYQHRSYFAAVKNVLNIENMYIDESKKGMSFRKYNDLLLIGGGGHRTGKDNNGFSDIYSFINKYCKRETLIYSWAAQDTMSLDKIPYIGRYSKNDNFVFTATGFNKWGITGSMTAALILCDLVCEKENEYAYIFSPERSILKPQLFVNTTETLTNFLTPTAKRCSHLGCALKWNKYEHSWDCACHGSRFTSEGKILDNPANKDLT